MGLESSFGSRQSTFHSSRRAAASVVYVSVVIFKSTNLQQSLSHGVERSLPPLLSCTAGILLKQCGDSTSWEWMTWRALAHITAGIGTTGRPFCHLLRASLMFTPALCHTVCSSWPMEVSVAEVYLLCVFFAFIIQEIICSNWFGFLLISKLNFFPIVSSSETWWESIALPPSPHQ